jgi:hypothetical protein
MHLKFVLFQPCVLHVYCMIFVFWLDLLSLRNISSLAIPPRMHCVDPFRRHVSSMSL